MRLLDKLDKISTQNYDFTSEKVLTHKLGLELEKLAHFKSLKDLEKSPVYQTLRNDVSAITFGYEYGCYADESKANPKNFYRAILWHLEHGQNFQGILDILRNRALLSKADIYFFPATDIGMARSDNRNVIRDLAIELGYNYFFATSYLHLNSENGDKNHPKNNLLGLEGNAIMTRLPLSNLRIIPLPNYHDPLKEKFKRIGCEKVLLADLVLPENKKLTVVCINLPLITSAAQRSKYIKLILKKISEETYRHPVLLAGDLKTSTYNCRSVFHFLMSVFNKKYRDYDYIIQEHHNFPERHFEKGLFHALSASGYDFESLNELGKGCYHCKPADLINTVPSNHFLFPYVNKLLNRYQESLSYKYDWFAADKSIKVSRSHQAERPKVITHLFHNGNPVSSHDPVLLDFEVVTELLIENKKD